MSCFLVSMLTNALSQLGFAVQSGSLTESVARGVDNPALGQTAAFLIAIAAFLVIGGLLFFYRWQRGRWYKQRA